MKITYFHYYVSPESKPEEKTLFDLRPILFNFCKYQNKKFRSSFKNPAGDSVFMFWVAEDTYLLIVTKSGEIIKTINSDEVNYEDLYARLSNNESLGFASYLYAGKHFYGLASTIFGPKNTSFSVFVNSLFNRTKVSGYEFVTVPFETQATRAEALSMSVVGKNIIEIGPGNSLFSEITGFFGLGNTSEIESLEITIKPGKKKNIKDSAEKIAEKLPDEDLKKYIVKAKNAASESLIDYYITGIGAISDSVVKNEKTLAAAMKNKAENNAKLQARIAEIIKNPQYEKTEISAINNLFDFDKWPVIIPNN